MPDIGELRFDNFRYLTGLGRKAFTTLQDVCAGMEAQGKHCRDHFFAMRYRADIQAWEAVAGNAHSYFEAGGLEVTIPGMDGLDLALTLRLGYLHPKHNRLVGTYSVYAHKLFFDRKDGPEDGYMYIGLTKQGWRQRLTGHLQATRSGSNTLFHRAIRAKPFRVSSHVLLVGATEDEAMACEEERVSAFSFYLDNPKGLNMIPGGRAGLRFLHERAGMGAVKIEDREAILDGLLQSRRISLPNPSVAAHWNDPGYAARVMCGRPDRFSVSELRKVTDMHAIGHSVVDLASGLGVSARRVSNLVSRKTYERVLK